MRASSMLLCSLVLMSMSAWGAPHDHPEPVVLAPGYTELEFQPPEPGTYELPPLGQAADGVVLNSSGKVGRLHDYLGDKITVLSFIFTRCNDVNGCPLATFVMKSVQQKMLDDAELRDQVRVVSFSFDPTHDTPEVLAAYGAHFRDPSFDWQFVSTQDEDALAPILAEYGQWVIKDYDDDGNFLGTMSHVLRVYLIDREKRVRNIYSTSYLHADTVGSDIATLLAEQAHP